MKDDFYQQVVNAFKALNHPHPEQEAAFVLIQMEGLGTIMIKEDNYEQPELIKYMQSKYTA